MRALLIVAIFTALIFMGRFVPVLEPLFNNAYVFGTLGAGLTYALIVKLGGASK